MAGFNLGDIYVTFKAKTDEFKRGMADAKSEVQGFGNKIKTSIGDTAVEAFGLLKKWALVAGVAIVGVIGKFVAVGGFTRALNIEDAQAKLKGLGHDVNSVKEIMDNALASVKGTAYSLDQAATIAASAVAAGVKPGKELEKYLKLTADAATIAGTSLSDMGRIFNNVQATGVVFNDNLQLLAEKGIPIYVWLSKQMGVTTADVKELASEGKISSEQFRQAIETNIAGASLAAGDTTRGAWENTKAAMARVGAAIAEKILPKVRNALLWVTKWFDDNKEFIVDNAKQIAIGIGVIGAALAIAFAPAYALAAGIIALVGALIYLQAKYDFVGKTLAFIQPYWQALVDIFTKFFLPSLKAVADSIVKNLWPALQQLWEALVRIWNALNPGLTEALKVIAMIIGVLLVGVIWLWINGMNIAIQVLSFIISVISNLINWLSNLYTWFGNIAGAGINAVKTILDWFGKIPGTIGGIVNSVVGWFKDLPGRIGSAIAGVADTITGPFKAAFNAISDFWNKTVAAVSFKAPDWVPGMGGKGWSIPRMPHLAMGTPNWRGGMVTVGEHGPETAFLPQGTRVTTADETSKMAKQGGDTIIINLDGMYASSRSQLRDVADEIIDAYNERARAQNKPALGSA